MIISLFLMMMINIAYSLEENGNWIVIGDGVPSFRYQEAELGTGAIRNELYYADDESIDYVMQTIVYIPADPDNVMVQDTVKKKVLITLYTMKNDESPYSISLINSLDGYSITIDNVNQDRSSKINGIRFTESLQQNSELRLGMVGPIFQFIKGATNQSVK